MAKIEKKTVPVTNTKKRGIGKGKILLGILFLFILAGIYLYYTYGALPMALLSAKQINATTLISIFTQRIDSVKNVRLSYSGTITINHADPIIMFSYNKSGNATRSNFSLFYVHGYPNVMASVYVPNNSTSGSSCAFYSYQLTSQNPSNTTLLPSGCYNTSTPYAIYSRMVGELVNVSTLTVKENTTNVQLINGQLYYCGTGSGFVMVNGAAMGTTLGYFPATFTLGTCLSAQYGIPLYIRVNITPTNVSAANVISANVIAENPNTTNITATNSETMYLNLTNTAASFYN